MSIHIFDSGSTSGLILLIRELVNQPSIQPELSKSPHFNRLCSAMDAIEDVEVIISGYKSSEFGRTIASRYLTIYGLLQALFVQMDAVKSIAKALDVPLAANSDLLYIRRIRILSVGHPTSANFKGEGELFAFITRFDLTSNAFSLSYYNSRDQLREHRIDVSNLLEKQENGLSDQLYTIFQALLEKFSSAAETPVPRGTLTAFIEGYEKLCRVVRINLDRGKSLDEGVRSTRILKERYIRFRNGIETLGKGDNLKTEDRSVATALDWLNSYLSSANDPLFQETHFAHSQIDMVEEKFARFLIMAEKLEGIIESGDDKPWIDISRRHLRNFV
jgi:hypothetical protein